MRRGRKPTSSIDERVEKQKLIVLKDKEKMDKDIAILDDLMKKQKELRNKKLLSAITKSNKSFEEIMAFLTENADGEARGVKRSKNPYLIIAEITHYKYLKLI